MDRRVRGTRTQLDLSRCKKEPKMIVSKVSSAALLLATPIGALFLSQHPEQVTQPHRRALVGKAHGINHRRETSIRLMGSNPACASCHQTEPKPRVAWSRGKDNLASVPVTTALFAVAASAALQPQEAPSPSAIPPNPYAWHGYPDFAWARVSTGSGQVERREQKSLPRKNTMPSRGPRANP
jgi:hypothetical protein